MSSNKEAPVDYGVTKDNFDPDAKPLTNEEVKQASQDLIRRYPRVIRYKYDPEIPRQHISNISFMLLKEPYDGVYGFFKPRGNWDDDEKATIESEELIQKVDSVFPIHHANVGYWNPITNNEKYTLDQMDVKTKKEDMALRDRAAKENAVKNAQLRKEMEEVKEEIQKLELQPDDDKDSLDYYTKKRVAQKELNGYILQANEKIKTLKKSLKKVNKEIIELNKSNPTYIDKWLDNYNAARVRVGLPKVEASDLSKPNIIGPIE